MGHEGAVQRIDALIERLCPGILADAARRDLATAWVNAEIRPLVKALEAVAKSRGFVEYVKYTRQLDKAKAKGDDETVWEMRDRLPDVWISSNAVRPVIAALAAVRERQTERMP